MSPNDLKGLEDILEAAGGLLINFASYIVAGLLSTVILTYGIRWFIFKKAGEKGWKALIPVYSDYIHYKIAWDGRIYIAILVGTIASAVLGTVCGWIHPGLGSFVSIVCNTIVAGASAIAGMILNFKMARAFGRNDYFAVGLYFLGNIFSAILAFGDSKYQGPARNDGIGVPTFVERFGRGPIAPRPPAPHTPPPPIPPLQPREPMQQPYAPFQPNPGYAPPPQGYAPPQQNYPMQPDSGFAPLPDGNAPQPMQRTRRSERNSGNYGQ